MASTIDILVDRNDLRRTMEQFRKLNFSLQKQYVTAAVRKTVKPELPSLKANTPRNRGGLARAAGVQVQPPRTKGNPNKYGVKVLAKIGFLRGKDPKGGKRAKKGYHAHLVELGVQRQAYRGTPFSIPWAINRKYQYLAPFVRRGSKLRPAAAILWHKRAVRGTGFFDKWWTGRSRAVLRKLTKALEDNLQKAIAHQARAAARRP